MVLRAGYKVGPGRVWDYAAAASGAAAVLLLGLFVGLAPTPAGYSHYRDPISRLGASGAPGQWWFTAVNVLEALLIVVFAYGVQRRVPVSLSAALLIGAVAPGSLTVAAFPCTGSCNPRAATAHTVGGSYSAVVIVTMMVVVGCAAHRHARGALRAATLVCSGANVAVFAVLLISVWGPIDGFGLWERLFWATAYTWVLIASAAIVLATRPPRSVPVIDPAVAQPNVLRSSGAWTEAAYVPAAIADPARVRAWLDDLLVSVQHPDWSVTLGFTHSGLTTLGIGYGANRSEAFVSGMKARAGILGDHGDSSPDRWDEPWRSKPIDALVWVEGTDRDAVEAALATVRSAAGADGLIFYESERAWVGSRAGGAQIALLGFRDGISQPWLAFEGAGDPSESIRWGGVLDPFGRLRPVAAGEFVLGLTDESGAVAPLPSPPEVFDGGSYLVVRKLAQNPGVDFDGASARAATAGGDGPRAPTPTELMVGRRRSGEPLEPTRASSTDNGFLYSGDPEGRRCPLAAHIRRANPRDALGFGSLLSARHRMIRRGKVFGAVLGEHTEDEHANGEHTDDKHKDGGLMFLAVTARIEDQFEFVQRLWLNDGSRQRVGTTSDFIAGSQGSNRPTIMQGLNGPRAVPSQPSLVRTVGGEYFFLPSRAGLHALAHSSIQPGQEIAGGDRLAAGPALDEVHEPRVPF